MWLIVSYGTIAGTWVPVIPPFKFWNHPLKFLLETLVLFLLELSASNWLTLFLMELSPVHLLTLPPFYIYVGHLPLKHFLVLRELSTIVVVYTILMELSPGLGYRRYLHFKLLNHKFFLVILLSPGNIFLTWLSTSVKFYISSYGTTTGIYVLVLPPFTLYAIVFPPSFWNFYYGTIGVDQNLHCFLWNYRRYFTDVTSIFYLRWAPLFEAFLVLRELSTIVVVYTIPYGTIAGTRLPVIPPFETF